MNENIPANRPAGTPLARAYGATDPDLRTAAVKEMRTRLVAASAVKKALSQGKKGELVAAFDAKGNLLGFFDAADLKPMSAAPPTAVKKALSNQLRAAAGLPPRPAGRQPDAVRIVAELGRKYLAQRVQKSGERLGDVDLLTTGALVRSKLPAAQRKHFDELLAKTSDESRKRLRRRLQQTTAQLGRRP